jgi:hypothetical protein
MMREAHSGGTAEVMRCKTRNHPLKVAREAEAGMPSFHLGYARLQVSSSGNLVI